jgi:hypothetical protein
MKLRKLAAITMAAAIMATMAVSASAEETTAAETEAAAAPEWVGVKEGGTAEINEWISYEKLGGVKNKPCLVLCSEDDTAEPPADSVLNFKVSDIYGFRFYGEFDKTTWDAWHGGQIGTNSALGGWATLVDYSSGSEPAGLTIDIDAGEITYLSSTALFDQAEQDQGGYAHIWLMDWSNGDDAVKIYGMDVLDKDGNVMTFDAIAAEDESDDAVEAEDETDDVVEAEDEADDFVETEDEPEPDETYEEPAATGDVDAATDSSKGSPDTGVADVAAVAGLGVLAAGAVIFAKKRK